MSDDRLDQIEAALRFLTVLRAGQPSQHMMDNLAEQERDLWAGHGPWLVEQVRELQFENERLDPHEAAEFAGLMRERDAAREQVRQRDEVIERVQAVVDRVDQTKSATVMVSAIYAALDGPR